MSKAQRNSDIAAAFKGGCSRTTLAMRHGLTPRRISQIAAAHGMHRYHADQVSMGLLAQGGRPKLFIPDGERPHYVKLRRIMGAAYARDAMGLS